MSGYLSAELRRQVAERARFLCEYCLIHETDTFYGCHVDHIISEKHGGLSTLDNLAYACALCNQAKGSDIASLAKESNALTRFFNPRVDRWSDHFGLVRFTIVAKTAIGEATARILGFNVNDRIVERALLNRFGRYPLPEAVALIGM
jgi:HNH endonuclease